LGAWVLKLPLYKDYGFDHTLWGLRYWQARKLSTQPRMHFCHLRFQINLCSIMITNFCKQLLSSV
jgi:hypothetical protein